MQVCQQIGVQIGFHIHDNKQLMSSQCRECQPLEKLENICSGNNDAREKLRKISDGLQKLKMKLINGVLFEVECS